MPRPRAGTRTRPQRLLVLRVGERGTATGKAREGQGGFEQNQRRRACASTQPPGLVRVVPATVQAPQRGGGGGVGGHLLRAGRPEHPSHDSAASLPSVATSPRPPPPVAQNQPAQTYRSQQARKSFLGFTCGRRHGGGTHRRPLWYIWRGSPQARGSPGLTAAVVGRAHPCRPPADPGLNPPSPPTPTDRWDSPGAPGGKILCRWDSPGRSD